MVIRKSGFDKLNLTFFLLEQTLLLLELLSENDESSVYFFNIPFTYYFEPSFELYEDELDSRTLLRLTH